MHPDNTPSFTVGWLVVLRPLPAVTCASRLNLPSFNTPSRGLDQHMALRHVGGLLCGLGVKCSLLWLVALIWKRAEALEDR